MSSFEEVGGGVVQVETMKEKRIYGMRELWQRDGRKWRAEWTKRA
jgi:hypothetical protein